MRVWTFLCLILAASGTNANIAMFWDLYDAVIMGGRILHDVSEGVGAVSKAIKAIDCFLDSSAEAQITEALAEAEAVDGAVDGAVNGETTAGTETADPIPPPPGLPDQSGITAPSFNGCGALGFHIRDESLPVNRLTDCCGVHDACYNASCRANKRQCDQKLRQCMFKVCDDKSVLKAQQKACKGAAKLLFSGTMALSSSQFYAAQGKLECRKPQFKGIKKR